MAKPQRAPLDELVASARQAAAAGDRAQALAFWRSVVDTYPGHEAGYIGIGETLRDVGRLDEAERAFAEGVRRFPDSEWLVIGHAGIARDRGDKAEALRRWQLACQKFPDNPAVEVGRGEALANLGEFDRAEALFREVMERFPAYDWAASHYAYIASRRYDWAEAVSRFEKVKARFPDHEFAYFALAEALRASNRTKEAALVGAEQDRRFRKNNIEGPSGPQERSPTEQETPGKTVGASAEIAVVAPAPLCRVSDATSLGPQGEREQRAGDGMDTVISISGSVEAAQVNRTVEPHQRNPEAGQLMQARLNFDKLIAGAADFEARLSAIKSAASVDFHWYPYHTLANFAHIEPLITAEYDPLFQPQKHYADFGCADGDLAYYLESQGNTLHLYDYGPTNMNGLLGARYLHRTLASSAKIIEADFDSQFQVSERYDLVFFLGLLYHLKNPFYALETLSRVSRFMLLSTRIARQFSANGIDISNVPAGYLLNAQEANNDPTNYWIFTEAGLKRLCERSGWDVMGFRTVGDTIHSNPQDLDRDERAFALLKSRR